MSTFLTHLGRCHPQPHQQEVERAIFCLTFNHFAEDSNKPAK